MNILDFIVLFFSLPVSFLWFTIVFVFLFERIKFLEKQLKEINKKINANGKELRNRISKVEDVLNEDEEE